MLAIGMPYDLYWNGELEAVDYYLNSVKYSKILKNNDMHLQGTYVLLALQEVLQFKNPVEIYPRTPLSLENEKRAPQTQEDVEREMKEMLARVGRGEV